MVTIHFFQLYLLLVVVKLAAGVIQVVEQEMVVLVAEAECVLLVVAAVY